MELNEQSSKFGFSSGCYSNTGAGPTMQLVDIGSQDYIALIDPDTAFWSLLKKDKIGDALVGASALMKEFHNKRDSFVLEINNLRFGLKPSAVYFNPTERCNLNCSYSAAFKAVTGRRVEDITPCSSCAIRHFCGSPCPAEAYEIHGAMNKPGAFCELYEEQVRYALRLIADGKENDFLWDGWDTSMSTSMEISSL